MNDEVAERKVGVAHDGGHRLKDLTNPLDFREGADVGGQCHHFVAAIFNVRRGAEFGRLAQKLAVLVGNAERAVEVTRSGVVEECGSADELEVPRFEVAAGAVCCSSSGG